MTLRALYDVPAPAKINLFLHVTGQRADGYHLLQVTLWVAASQRAQAFKTLETFARENAPHMFDGAHNVTIDDIVEAITLTLKSQVR